MKALIAKLRHRYVYWQWRRNMRTSVMPLGHGNVAVASGFLGGQPMIALSPLPDRLVGEPGTDASATVSFENMGSISDLPPGTVVLAFKDVDALWRHRSIVHKLWAEAVNNKGEPA